MAKTASRSPRTSDAQPAEIAAKAKAAAQRIVALKADLKHAQGLVHQAQVREALSRTELTLALTEALRALAAADLAARGRTATLRLQGLTARPLRRRTRFDRGFDRLLAKAGRTGQARLIADAGIWRSDDDVGIQGYVARGADPAARPATLFDQAWHLATYPQVAGSGRAPLVHYLMWGAAQGHSPHPLFHPNFYASRNAAELGGARVTPLEHFLRRGAAQGRDPHPAFDIRHYLGQAPELAAGEDPVSHYVRQGWRDGLSPHPLFSPAWYRRQMPRQAADVPPLVHYLTEGWRAGLSPHPLFDPAWYAEQYADVGETGAEPLTHFLVGGAAEGRNPSPWFDTQHYVAARGAAFDPAVNPLVDYLQGGAWAVDEARPGLPTAAYLAATPELAGQGLTPLEHWARKAAGG